MEVLVNRKELVEKTGIIGLVVKENKIRPVMGSLVLTTIDNVIKIIGSDLNVTISNTIKGTIAEQGNVAINIKTLLKVIKSFKSEMITIKSNDTTTTVSDTEGSEINIDNYNVNDYPIDIIENQSNKNKTEYEINLKELANAISQVKSNINKSKQTDLHLENIQLKCKDNKLNIFATDNYRLAQQVVECNSSDFELLLAPAIYKLIEKLGCKAKTNSSIKFSSDIFSNFKINDYFITCKAIIINYFPNCFEFVEGLASTEDYIIVQSNEFKSIISEFKTLSKKGGLYMAIENNLLRLEFKDEGINVVKFINVKGNIESTERALSVLHTQNFDINFIYDSLLNNNSLTTRIEIRRDNSPISILHDYLNAIQPRNER